ncbi:tetratricopeptide repeat protein, partial [candidate division KSB1 bacterium]|nr:tetratricopeptide repeat protein [candidate division KSB1 bacterium]
MYKRLLYIVLLFVLGNFAGCAYYNTFYNAKKFYKEAENERKKRQRTQVVQLSPEEMLQQQKQGLVTSSLDGDKPSSAEMQNYQRAIEKASSVLEFYPKSRWVDDALLMVGECFYYRREYAKSLRKFEEIIKLYPNSSFIPQAHLMLAKNYLGLSEFEKAENKFREIALDDKMPKDVRQEAEYELAGLYFVKGSYEQAANEYRRTAKESDDKLIRAMSYYRLGECLISLHHYQEAPAVFKRAVDESPNEDFKAQATFKLGESQSLVEDYDAAIRTFSNLLAKELEPRRIPMIKLQLANNLRLKGELEDAIKWYNNIIKDHKNTDASAKSYFALGDIEENLNNNYAKAKENYELVRGEFANSSIAPEAKSRADYIGQYMDLKKSINELLGITSAG